MSYTPILSVTVPTSGGCKQLWSPQLFNASTGVYSAPTSASVAGYPLDNSGRMQFYEGCKPSTGATGYVQCTLTNPPSTTYWDAEYNVLNASTRDVITSGTFFKGSLAYTYRPGYVYPYIELNQVHYTDAIAPETGGPFSGGNDQKTSLPVGTYILQFKEVNGYQQLLAGPPATFTTTTSTSASTMEFTVIVSEGAVTTQAFTRI
jgi:hypothetical protein